RSACRPRVGGPGRRLFQKERRAECSSRRVRQADGGEAVAVKWWGLILLAAVRLPGQAPADLASLQPLYEQALAELEKSLGPEPPKVARSASDLGLFLSRQGDTDAAESALRRALAIDEKRLGERDPLVASDRENLGMLLESGGHLFEAAVLFRKAAE